MSGAEPKRPQGARLARRHRAVAISLAALVVGMVGMSYAAVPLYRLFCQVTGYAGTTQRAKLAPETVLDRVITVRFDANVARDLPWRFAPVLREVKVKLGEQALVFYRATNLSNAPTAGTASFNVTPETMGRFFSKIQCFCFTEQKLAPGATAELPLTFFVDPKMVDDLDARGVQEVTLSYTFFRSGGEAEVAGAPQRNGKGS